MKKILAVLITLILCISAFASCSGNDIKDTEISVTTPVAEDTGADSAADPEITDTEADAETETDPKIESSVETEPESEPAEATEGGTEAKTEAVTEAETKSVPDTKSAPETAVGIGSDEETEIIPELSVDEYELPFIPVP